MTPAERAAALAVAVARHPSTYRSGVSEHPPFDATSVAGEASAAAGVSPVPTPWEFCHATVTSINDAADRLRALKDRAAAPSPRP